jgi:hypothetical protein
MAQRAQLVIRDDGNTSAPEFIYDPACCGWEISIKSTVTQPMFPQLTITARDKFEDGPALQTFGPFFGTVGGKLFVPYSTFSITGVDSIANNVGNTTTVNIVARPVMADENCKTGTKVVGADTSQSIAATATASFNVPESAIGYKVTVAGASTSYSVAQRWSAAGASVSVLDYDIDPTITEGPDSGGQRWRDTFGSPNIVNVTNTDAANTGDATVFYLFDFARPL